MSEDSSSKEEIDLAAIEEHLNNSLEWCEDYEVAGRSPLSDIAALLARARQQDARIAELEAEMDRVKDTAAGVHMANKLLEFDKTGLKEEVARLREEKADLEQALYGEEG